jgi:CheY-like chemotaxis protein
MVNGASVNLPSSPHPRILLADRDADTRSMYAEFLRRMSYEIDEAEDGREALAKAISTRPDVIVTETRLAGLNGMELCRLLRTDVATRDVPIIFVTGDAYDEQIEVAKAAGADTILVKPCLPETLVAEMQRLHRSSAELRERAREMRDKAARQLERSTQLLERSRNFPRRLTMSRAHSRHDTTMPSLTPPSLVCPACDQPLHYQRSHIGGVSARHPEQWDYYECDHGCGTFQYRQRTRKLRRFS